MSSQKSLAERVEFPLQPSLKMGLILSTESETCLGEEGGHGKLNLGYVSLELLPKKFPKQVVI